MNHKIFAGFKFLQKKHVSEDILLNPTIPQNALTFQNAPKWIFKRFFPVILSINHNDWFNDRKESYRKRDMSVKDYW